MNLRALKTIQSIVLMVVLIFGSQVGGVQKVEAASIGPNSPDAAVGAGMSSYLWSNVSNVYVDDSSYASAPIGTQSGGGGGGPCLSPDTLISTPNGVKRLDQMEIGDFVYSYNVDTDEIETNSVSDVIQRPISEAHNRYFNIYYGNQVIKATENHQFYIGNQLKRADELVVGDMVLGIDGVESEITNIIIEENYTDTVWDLSINNNHNFFANGILVHNAGAVYDNDVKIIKGGVLGSQDKASADAWPVSFASKSYGGASDLWGETWTASDINSSSFGIAVSAYGSGFSVNYAATENLLITDFDFAIPDGSIINGIVAEVIKESTATGAIQARIDHVGITVYYTEGDSTAPTVTNVTSDKANGQYKAGEVIDIDVTFSEAVTSTGNVTVTLETGATDRTCTFTVSNNTTGTCNYTVQAGDTSADLTVSSISGTIADQSANAMSNFVPATNLAANKALVVDTTAPSVSITAPTEGATVSGASVAITATASDTNLVGVQFKRDTNTNIGAEDTTSTYGVTWDTTGLSDGAQSLIAVARDTAGNYATSTAISVTVDNTAPTIQTLSPADNVTDVLIDDSLSITFNEVIYKGTGNIVIKHTSDDSTFETIDVTGGAASLSSLDRLSLNPTSDLSPGTSYYVQIPNTAIVDGAGNQFAGISNTTTWNFTTVAEEEEEESSGSGGMNIDIDASCSISDTTLKTGEETDIEVEIEATKNGEEIPYTFKWTKVLLGDDEEISHSFDTEGEYIIKGQVSTQYKTQTVTCDTVTVKDSNSSSSSSSNDNDEEDEETEDVDTDSFSDIISKYKDFLTTLHDLGITLPANVVSMLDIKSTTTSSSQTIIFTQDLELGVSHPEVKLLQQFLNSEGYTVAETGPGSKGNETEMFGYATQAALIRFQKENGISPAVGYFGPVTRSAINNI